MGKGPACAGQDDPKALPATGGSSTLGAAPGKANTATSRGTSLPNAAQDSALNVRYETLLVLLIHLMSYFSYERLALPYCTGDLAASNLPPTPLLHGFPCTSSRLAQLAYLVARAPWVLHDMLHVRAGDFWLTASIHAWLLRMVCLFVLPARIYKFYAAPATSYFMRAYPLVHHLALGPRHQLSGAAARCMFGKLMAAEVMLFVTCQGWAPVWLEVAHGVASVAAMGVLCSWYRIHQPQLGLQPAPQLLLRVLVTCATLLLHVAWHSRRREVRAAGGAGARAGAPARHLGAQQQDRRQGGEPGSPSAEHAGAACGDAAGEGVVAAPADATCAVGGRQGAGGAQLQLDAYAVADQGVQRHTARTPLLRQRRSAAVLEGDRRAAHAGGAPPLPAALHPTPDPCTGTGTSSDLQHRPPGTAAPAGVGSPYTSRPSPASPEEAVAESAALAAAARRSLLPPYRSRLTVTTQHIKIPDPAQPSHLRAGYGRRVGALMASRGVLARDVYVRAGCVELTFDTLSCADEEMQRLLAAAMAECASDDGDGDGDGDGGSNGGGSGAGGGGAELQLEEQEGSSGGSSGVGARGLSGLARALDLRVPAGEAGAAAAGSAGEGQGVGGAGSIPEARAAGRLAVQHWLEVHVEGAAAASHNAGAAGSGGTGCGDEEPAGAGASPAVAEPAAREGSAAVGAAVRVRSLAPRVVALCPAAGGQQDMVGGGEPGAALAVLRARVTCAAAADAGRELNILARSQGRYLACRYTVRESSCSGHGGSDAAVTAAATGSAGAGPAAASGSDAAAPAATSGVGAAEAEGALPLSREWEVELQLLQLPAKAGALLVEFRLAERVCAVVPVVALDEAEAARELLAALSSGPVGCDDAAGQLQGPQVEQDGEHPLGGLVCDLGMWLDEVGGHGLLAHSGADSGSAGAGAAGAQPPGAGDGGGSSGQQQRRRRRGAEDQAAVAAQRLRALGPFLRMVGLSLLEYVESCGWAATASYIRMQLSRLPSPPAAARAAGGAAGRRDGAAGAVGAGDAGDAGAAGPAPAGAPPAAANGTAARHRASNGAGSGGKHRSEVDGVPSSRAPSARPPSACAAGMAATGPTGAPPSARLRLGSVLLRTLGLQREGPGEAEALREAMRGWNVSQAPVIQAVDSLALLSAARRCSRDEQLGALFIASVLRFCTGAVMLLLWLLLPRRSWATHVHHAVAARYGLLLAGKLVAARVPVHSAMVAYYRDGLAVVLEGLVLSLTNLVPPRTALLVSMLRVPLSWASAMGPGGADSPWAALRQCMTVELVSLATSVVCSLHLRARVARALAAGATHAGPGAGAAASTGPGVGAGVSAGVGKAASTSCAVAEARARDADKRTNSTKEAKKDD